MTIWTIVCMNSLREIPVICDAGILHFQVFRRLKIYVLRYTLKE